MRLDDINQVLRRSKNVSGQYKKEKKEILNILDDRKS
jgi:hypothetical protein